MSSNVTSGMPREALFRRFSGPFLGFIRLKGTHGLSEAEVLFDRIDRMDRIKHERHPVDPAGDPGARFRTTYFHVFAWSSEAATKRTTDNGQ